MNHTWRYLAHLIAVLCLTCSLSACGGSPWRFSSGVPEAPTGLVATSANAQVSLSWSSVVSGLSAYRVYYASTPGVTKGNGTAVSVASGTTALISGLANGTRYYFVVSALNSKGDESPLSAEVSSIPSLPGPFLQTDLEGTWRFNALVSGVEAKWMRGTVVIGASGAVSVSSFLDSSSTTSAPVGLFSNMTLLPDGTVLQDGAAADFHGVVSANLHKDMMVGTGNLGSSSRVMIILQKSVDGITFSAADIRGTGRLVAGPLTLVYHQLSSGALSEWENASCQIGQDQALSYATLSAPSGPQLPGLGNKVVTLSITGAGIVTESATAGVSPQPAALITQGVMSADKMTIVGTATDVHGAFILRVVQLIHPPAILLTQTSYLLTDLAGSYGYHALIGGAAPLWAHGTQDFGVAGGASFSSYRDASGSTTLPGADTLALDQQGLLTNSADASYNGQLSYFKDMIVSTRTEASGASSLSINLRGTN
jgi:hypothetical protein